MFTMYGQHLATDPVGTSVQYTGLPIQNSQCIMTSSDHSPSPSLSPSLYSCPSPQTPSLSRDYIGTHTPPSCISATAGIVSYTHNS